MRGFFSSEGRLGRPQLHPRHAQLAADIDVGMRGFLVLDVLRVAETRGERAVGWRVAHAMGVVAEHDHRRRWRRAVAAEPERIHRTDRPWQAMAWPVQVDR